MTRLRCLVLLTGFFLVSGCAPKVSTLGERPNCSSSLEGHYNSAPAWTGPTPALIVTDGDDPYWIAGEINEVRKDGIVFDEEGLTPTRDPAPEFYSDDQISTYIDSSGTIVRGSLPPKLATRWKIMLFVRHERAVDGREKQMVLQPNSRFGFCMKPGTYVVEDIHFEVKESGDRQLTDGDVSEATRFGSIQFSVAADSANDLGRIRLNKDSLGQSSAYPIPISKEMSVTTHTGEAPRGMPAPMPMTTTFKIPGFTRIHAIAVEQEPDFQPKASLPLNPTPLQIEPNEDIVANLDSIVTATEEP